MLGKSKKVNLHRSAAGGSGGFARIVTQLTESGTYHKPANLQYLEVICIGGGGGAASGGKRASGVSAPGGGGAGPGCIAWHRFIPSALPDDVDYVVGAGGAGGASQETNDTNGIAGAEGGDTFFGSFIYAQGGARSTNSNGATTRTVDILLPSSCIPGGAGGNQGGSGSGQNTSNNYNLYNGAGGGGQVHTSNTALGGATPARMYNSAFELNPLWTINANQDGNDGIDGFYDRVPFITVGDPAFDGILFSGTSGAGGGASSNNHGCRGGNGGLYGGGGGGGGGCRNGAFNSGPGGNGAQGTIILIEYLS
jgi:hypothetical protein